MTLEQRQFILTCRDQYLTDLKENIMPFWMKYGLDRVNGGVYTCLDRDGTVAQPAKGNIFKGPFHVPRMMIRAAMLCDDILAE